MVELWPFAVRVHQTRLCARNAACQGAARMSGTRVPARQCERLGPACRQTVHTGELEAAMAFIKFVSVIRGWYHANDEVFLSERFQQQRAQAVLNYYAHVGDPTCG